MRSKVSLALANGALLGLLHISGAVEVEWLGGSAGDRSVPALFPATLSILGLAALFRIWHMAALSNRPALNGALVGGASGFGYYLISLHWLGHAFLGPDETYSALAFLGEAGSLLLFFPWWLAAMGLAATLRHRLSGGSLFGAALLWACSMSIADTLLADIAYQIPLAPLSAVLIDTPFDRLISSFGTLGANLVMLTAASCLGVSMLGRPLPGLIGLVLPVLGATAFPAPGLIRSNSSATIAVVQPAGEQRIRPTYFDRESWMGDLDREIRSALRHQPSAIILPELSIPFDPSLEEDARDFNELLALVPESTAIFFGYYTAELRQKEIISQNRMVAYRGGALMMAYDKAHLVPFGEFVPPPFAQLGFAAMTGPSTGLTAGNRIEIWNLPNMPKFAVLICYEALLTGAVSREAQEAEWLVNATSEVMLRNTLGPYLTLQYTRMRSIETGKPLFRAASTGWSAIIDSDGALIASIPRGTSGVLAHEIPDQRITLFARHGYSLLYAAWLALFVMALGFGSASRRK